MAKNKSDTIYGFMGDDIPEGYEDGGTIYKTRKVEGPNGEMGTIRVPFPVFKKIKPKSKTALSAVYP